MAVGDRIPQDRDGRGLRVGGDNVDATDEIPTRELARLGQRRRGESIAGLQVGSGTGARMRRERCRDLAEMIAAMKPSWISCSRSSFASRQRSLSRAAVSGFPLFSWTVTAGDFKPCPPVLQA